MDKLTKSAQIYYFGVVKIYFFYIFDFDKYEFAEEFCGSYKRPAITENVAIDATVDATTTPT
jgi:hypothetical protein